MNTPINHNKNKSLSLLAAIVLGLSALLGLQACGGGGGSSIPNADPAGYYTGTASVKQNDNTTPFEITDLQVMVNGTSIMAMSVSNVILYDITVGDINGSSYTGAVTVYKDGILFTTTTVSGTITEGTGLTGTFVGSDIVNGSFTVAYDTRVNATDASLAIIGSTSYRGGYNASTVDLRIDIDATGNVVSSFASTDAVKFEDCNIVAVSTYSPVPNQNLYIVNFTFSGCTDGAVNGSYTGLMSVFDDLTLQTPLINGSMPLSFSNGNYAGTGNIELN